MNKAKIKRRLHRTDISEIENRIGMLEGNLDALRSCLKEHPLDRSKINDILLGLKHGTPNVIQKVGIAVDSVGKEMK